MNHDIEFDDIYIDADQQAMKQMIELSGQMSVPFTTIESHNSVTQSVIGYDEIRLKTLLAAA